MRPPALPVVLAACLAALPACGGAKGMGDGDRGPGSGDVAGPVAAAGPEAAVEAVRPVEATAGAGAVAEAGAAAPPPSDGRVTSLALSLPDATWGVRVEFADGVKVVEDRVRAAGPWRRVVCGNGNARLRATVTLAPLPERPPDAPAPTAAGVRDAGLERIRARAREPLDGVRAFTAGPVAACEFVVHQARGIPVEEKTVHAWLVHGTHLVEVEVAILRCAPVDQARVDAVLAGFRIVDPFTPTARDCWRFAGCHVDAGDAAKAEADFARALALELAQPSPGEWWRDLVWEAAEWRLGNGDRAGADAAVGVGLARDPRWAPFHFAGARVAAAGGDREGALAQLRTAAECRAGLPEGERLPDPRADEWLGPWMAEDAFRTAAEAMGY